VSVIGVDLLRTAERVGIPGMSGDSGAPMSYLTLESGTPVFASDGAEVGRVAHVLAVPEADIFDGLVVTMRRGGHRFVDAPQVADIAEGGVTLTVGGAAVEGLPQPSENPAEMSADPEDTAESDLTRKLRRAWDLISGNY
jgi:hypothetical protein